MSAYVPAARGEDLLYQVLDEHLQTFLAACEECLDRPSATPRLWSARGPPVAA
ncbi:MAG: hypothetical protein ABMA64_34720 [Myxococcota bacterium]